MLICVFIVGVLLLLYASGAEERRNKKIRSMSMDEFKVYWRTGELPTGKRKS